MDPESEIKHAESLHRELRVRVGFEAVDGEGNRMCWNEGVEADVYGLYRTHGYEAPRPEAPVRV